jgi:hypothetical protein
MMAIPAISSLLPPISSLGSISKSLGISSVDEVASTSGVSSPGKMMQSILQSLSQLPSKNPTAANQTSDESVNNFIQSLVDAIQAQQNSSQPTANNYASKAFSNQNQFEQGLQSLIDQVSLQKNNPSQEMIDQLGQNADQLFASIGAQTVNQALGQFLGSLQQSFAGSSPVGNILSVKA